MILNVQTYEIIFKKSFILIILIIGQKLLEAIVQMTLELEENDAELQDAIFIRDYTLTS